MDRCVKIETPASTSMETLQAEVPASPCSDASNSVPIGTYDPTIPEIDMDRVCRN